MARTLSSVLAIRWSKRFKYENRNQCCLQYRREKPQRSLKQAEQCPCTLYILCNISCQPSKKQHHQMTKFSIGSVGYSVTKWRWTSHFRFNLINCFLIHICLWNKSNLTRVFDGSVGAAKPLSPSTPRWGRGSGRGHYSGGGGGECATRSSKSSPYLRAKYVTFQYPFSDSVCVKWSHLSLKPVKTHNPQRSSWIHV